MAPGNARARAAVDEAGGAGASVRPRRPQSSLRPVGSGARLDEFLRAPRSAGGAPARILWVPNMSPLWIARVAGGPGNSTNTGSSLHSRCLNLGGIEGVCIKAFAV